MLARLRLLDLKERGQGLVEYALILVFVAVVTIAILTVLSPGISEIYQNIVDHL
ncbi:MAG: pilus assembly protein [Anaerolineae bacterium]|nr:pilus assembly protein [Anaerolineae bacterium]